MAQSTQLDDPVSVARAAFTAYEAKDWRRVARVTHPDALAQLREQNLRMARAWEARPPLAAVHDSTVPEGVARYFDEIHARSVAEHGNPMLAGFSGVSSVAEFERLSPEAVLIAYLEGQAPKPENYDGGRPPVSTRKVIGGVPEADSVVHVVYRIHTDVGRFGETEEVDVLTLRRAPSGWRIMLNDDLSWTR
jgi:hypothetical protein